MVVWVFAGGGETEVKGLIFFLEKNFPGCRFERRTPVKLKPGPKPNKKRDRADAYGKTGKSLINQIKKKLPDLKMAETEVNLILVLDDLDCRDAVQQRDKILIEIDKIPEAANLEKFVGFAAPEIEAWIIADWNNSIAKHPDFRGGHEWMRWWLSQKRNVSFDKPESFSEYNYEKDCCQEKLSDALIKSTQQAESPPYLNSYSKALHTPDLLREVKADVVQQKCPIFRELYNYLNNFCRN